MNSRSYYRFVTKGKVKFNIDLFHEKVQDIKKFEILNKENELIKYLLERYFYIIKLLKINTKQS
ncbi:hypothetical protein J3D55_003492 [Chryseobacterium ginsenosidimutans]|jgi:hypothetical protein|nr:hypothetical protein [Chryseobacterium ginsenosidimutans]